MRTIGFSTGAIAKGDFRKGLTLQPAECEAVELSALREHELEPLLASLEEISVDHYQYVSVHAPSRLVNHGEEWLLDHLQHFRASWPVVVHPDLIKTPEIWRSMGNRLCLENMDTRKPTGRTADELESLFDQLPDAGFCFDAGHARQMDPTMSSAIEMLHRFGRRLRQLHVSDVGTFGEHRPIGYLTRLSFEIVAKLIPEDVPIIIESIVESDQLQHEVDIVRQVFDTAA